MRAHYKRDIKVSDEYELVREELHHLINVVRIRVGEELLLLNGQGLMVQTEVTKVSKSELKLKMIRHSIRQRPFDFNLALGMPKREALELALKEATEIGFSAVYLIKSDRSQIKIPEKQRIENILISALEQSNAPWMPEIKYAHWNDLPWEEMDASFLLDSQSVASPTLKPGSTGKLFLLLGPEGGFSDEELTFLHSKDVLQIVNLPTPILRTPTALAVGAGMMIQSLLKC
jgi:16S rRNA (uracil1498-N3)-methyltransferase